MNGAIQTSMSACVVSALLTLKEDSFWFACGQLCHQQDNDMPSIPCSPFRRYV